MTRPYPWINLSYMKKKSIQTQGPYKVWSFVMLNAAELHEERVNNAHLTTKFILVYYAQTSINTQSFNKYSNNHSIFLHFHRPQLPARATRLLNRSRLQQPPQHTSIANSRSGSDSPRSLDSFQRKMSPRPSCNLGTTGGRDSNSSPDDNTYMLDKSLRNTMIQDVLCFKKQLIRLRSLLQEVMFRVIEQTQNTFSLYFLFNFFFF